ncbi:hypothetical protein R9C00_08910 [Flammeovirgaceae bacterium SG7u.111]|nr:hypothetical protein [Flammeovirgaceae bacterium SG7u.132]WPO37568.1 hypothetical protein R9C00_08910 [Flammeovirgaceae bacterium SG7u.111]
MSIGKAIRFVRKFARSHEFRKECHSFSRQELLETFEFDAYELEDAINMQLVKCQTEDEAIPYLQLRMYYQLL